MVDLLPIERLTKPNPSGQELLGYSRFIKPPIFYLTEYSKSNLTGLFWTKDLYIVIYAETSDTKSLKSILSEPLRGTYAHAFTKQQTSEFQSQSFAHSANPLLKTNATTWLSHWRSGKF